MFLDSTGAVTFHEDNNKGISLAAEVVEGQVTFMVEKDGVNNHFSDFNEAVKEYIKLLVSK